MGTSSQCLFCQAKYAFESIEGGGPVPVLKHTNRLKIRPVLRRSGLNESSSAADRPGADYAAARALQIRLNLPILIGPCAASDRFRRGVLAQKLLIAVLK